MKVLLTTLNAKYIHTSLALRWLYVVNKDRFALSFKEYTIKEQMDFMIDDILETACDVLGISVSIWNVSQTKELVRELKLKKPELIIVVGGPEVSYEPAYFLENWEIDYVISGEGEFVLGELLHKLATQATYMIDGVSDKTHYSTHVARADVARLESYPSPYQLEEDREDSHNRLLYFETSRGCPYACQYCLSSLEKGIRDFSEEYILDNLRFLLASSVKQIKFLDRTFNLNKKRTATLFSFLIEHYRPGLSCQFEIYADLLHDELIDWLNKCLPQAYFRFEIGVQSTYEPTNRAVQRKQDFTVLADKIKQLMEGGKIDLHVDLLAGLPHENYQRFVQSFNEVFTLRPKEVQLGFLKMLRGTALRKNANEYGYVFDQEAPYEIISNHCLSRNDLDRIHEAEHALEKFWNSGRFALTLNYLFDTQYQGHYFELFDQIAQYYLAQQLPHRGYQLEDLFRYLHRFFLSKGINALPLLRDDYYKNFNIKPHGFWTQSLEKKERKRLLYAIGQDKEFLNRHRLTRKIIEKQTAIDPLGKNEYQLTVFIQKGEQFQRLKLQYTLNTKPIV